MTPFGVSCAAGKTFKKTLIASEQDRPKVALPKPLEDPSTST